MIRTIATILPMISFSAIPARTPPPAKYDDLFIITVPDQGALKVEKTTYGKPAGRFDQ